MKILYGVVGEGMGHAMRSSVILDHLHAASHEIRIVASGRACEYLSQRHPGQVTEISGLTMAYRDNVVRKLRTLKEALKTVNRLPENVQRYFELSSNFHPDVVVSDFESWSYLFARALGIPVISVDNMQVIARCRHEPDLLKHELPSFLLAKGVVKAKLPKANSYLITTFFYPEIKKERTSLFPPILRRVILEAKRRVEVQDHILVYQSAAGFEGLVQVMKEIRSPFRIYGMRRDLRAEEQDDNLTYCPFSEERFIRDLATSRAVLAGGGFTLLGEALFLGKPVLSVPLDGQFEQILNANYLQKLGFGERASDVTAEQLLQFLEKSSGYAENLGRFEHDHNQGIMSALDAAIIKAVSEGALA